MKDESLLAAMEGVDRQWDVGVSLRWLKTWQPIQLRMDTNQEKEVGIRVHWRFDPERPSEKGPGSEQAVCFGACSAGRLVRRGDGWP